MTILLSWLTLPVRYPPVPNPVMTALQKIMSTRSIVPFCWNLKWNSQEVNGICLFDTSVGVHGQLTKYVACNYTSIKTHQQWNDDSVIILIHYFYEAQLSSLHLHICATATLLPLAHCGNKV